MKISGPGQIRSSSVKKSEKKKTTGGTSFASQIGGDNSTQQAAGVIGTGPLTAMDVLLSVQETPDATEGRSKGLQRADEMIDLLEEFRRGILLGAIPLDKLNQLANMARNSRGKTGDSKLDEILEEIELRAEVEIAKLGM